MNNKKRKAIKEDTPIRGDNKTTIVGYLERGSKLRLQTINPDDFVPDLVRANVDTESVLMTDTANTYYKVGKDFAHHGVVDHKKKEYGRGINYTNGIKVAFHFLIEW